MIKKIPIISLGVIICLFFMVVTGGCASQPAAEAAKQEVVIEKADDVQVQAEEPDMVIEDGSPDTGDTPEGELHDGALQAAQLYIEGKTGYTDEAFEWKVESLVKDNEDIWWARVSAIPHDSSLEAHHVYLYRPMGMFSPIVDFDIETNPATDERFPEEIRDKL